MSVARPPARRSRFAVSGSGARIAARRGPAPPRARVRVGAPRGAQVAALHFLIGRPLRRGARA